MAVEVILPKVDMDMTTGRITKWFVAEGAQVTAGEPLFEIETDKAAMEIEAPAAGTLAHVVGAPNVDIAVGAPVAWIVAEGESAGDAPPVALQPAMTKEGASTPKSPLFSSEDLSVPAPSGEHGPGEKPRATPLARRLARTAEIALSAIRGSGPRGRITRADVERCSAAATPAVPPPDDDNVTYVPHSAMRRTIARRLVASIKAVPHFTVSTDCRIDALKALRAELNAGAGLIEHAGDLAPQWKITVNDMVVKALAAALHAVPEANVTWTEEAMAHHAHVDVAVAVAVAGGLVAPVVRRAQTKSLSAISGEMRDLAARAREGRLERDEYRGGTTNVSNLGMHGVTRFAAIINPPQSTSLAVGRAERRPVFADDGVSVIGGTLMTVTLSADHRAIDGVLAARMLAAFKGFIEEPLRLVV